MRTKSAGKREQEGNRRDMPRRVANADGGGSARSDLFPHPDRNGPNGGRPIEEYLGRFIRTRRSNRSVGAPRHSEVQTPDPMPTHGDPGRQRGVHVRTFLAMQPTVDRVCGAKRSSDSTDHLGRTRLVLATAAARIFSRTHPARGTRDPQQGDRRRPLRSPVRIGITKGQRLGERPERGRILRGWRSLHRHFGTARST